jgi:diguanylate cyclase (GGDEF)-like protein/PAS domain S-box-containing protein
MGHDLAASSLAFLIVQQTHRAWFFSVRLRILLFAGLTLVFTTGAFSWLALRQLDERQGAAQIEQQVRSTELASRLFQQQSARLQSLGTLAADLPGVREAMRKSDVAILEKVFDPFWSDLNLNHGLDRVAFFGPDSAALSAWGMADVGTRAQQLARAAVRMEAPQYWLECGVKCLYTTAVPLVEGGQIVGSIVLATGLQDMVMDFRRLSGFELAVIDAPKPGAGSAESGNANPRKIFSVSGGKTFETLVHALSGERRELAPAVSDSAEPVDSRGWVFQLTREHRRYRLYDFAAPAPGAGGVRFLAIADMTAEWQELNNAVRDSMQLGALILVLALGLLYLLLRATMNRLRQAMTALPLLGEGRYDEARAAFGQRQQHAVQTFLKFRDEVDDLAELTYALANTLELLHAESRQHATSLRAQATQLEQERDFIAGLLDTAPVLILTYGRDGRIRLANAHAVRSCGLPGGKLLGQSFADVFMNIAQAESHAVLLSRLQPGEVPHSEGSFERADGVSHDVIWFHSCLEEDTGQHLFLSVGLDVTEYRKVERNLRLLSEHDSVTGLFNRRAFKRELDVMLALGRHGMLLVLDIDEFKAVNESGGHEGGDFVLAECARYIQNLHPHPTLAARLGADDFALVLTDISPAEAIVLARGLNHGLPSSNSENATSPQARITASVGLVVFPEHGDSADTLLANAEIALTQARSKGHGSWHLYTLDDPYREAAGRRAYWREQVERGLDEDNFIMHFQPIMNIVSGRIGHYEALIRLQGADGKLIPPGMFIDVAESTGLIRRIDRWVIETVVSFVARQAPQIKVALNLSSRSFDDDVAFETMQAALARHNLTGDRLLLEITETAALANLSSAIRIMGKLRGLGCAFGLDDFGVGYSSFQYLKELPFDFVKIDGSFVKGLTMRPDDVVFVKALNDAVKGYGKATIAEFVEDEATLCILREIGVDYAQGYLIGRPAPELQPD